MTTIINQNTPDNIYDILIQDALQEFMGNMMAGVIEYLARSSPRGASPDSSALYSNWEVNIREPVKTEDLRFTYEIDNPVPDAEERIIGRGPGPRTDASPGSPLARWARVILGDANAAYPVADKIAEEGTERWRSGDNILGATRSGDVPRGSTVEQLIQAAISRDWTRVRIE